MADQVETKLHIAMFPWSGFGHMITFLELAKSIAQKGVKISFLSTTRNIDRLQNIPLPPHLSSLITFVKLTLPKVDGLPENAEATMDMGLNQIPFLMKALDGLQPELTRFLESESPDWIICDFTTYWLPQVAAKLGISQAYFSIFTPWFLAYTGSSPDDMINNSDVRRTPEEWLAPPPWFPVQSKVALHAHELDGVLDSTSTNNPSGISMMFRSGSIFSGSDAIFIRHSMEFAPEWIDVLEKIHKKPVIPVGLIPPSVQDGRANDNNETWLTIKEWLDTQNKGSVVYVALGSEVPLSQDQLTELALGLEMSGLPFFWALRKPSSSSTTESAVELPDGFLERNKGKGKVWTSWAPQLSILSHDSVGGFLSHSGWGSVIEGLMLGNPLILLPFSWEQGLNARLLVERKLGIEVPRNEEDGGSYTRKSVAESVRLVMVEDDGKIYKEKVKEFGTINGDKELHKKYIDNVVNHLEAHKQ